MHSFVNAQMLEWLIVCETVGNPWMVEASSNDLQLQLPLPLHWV